MSESTKRIRRRDCVKLSNKIIERCKLPIPRVVSIDGIRSNLFTSLLQVLYHRLPEGIIEDPASTEDEIANVQSIINHLALDLIHIDLSHISGAEVIAGDPRAIYNLLEIFCGLHKYLSSTSIGKWNLEETLSETNSELSSQPSSEESGTGGGQEQEESEAAEVRTDGAAPAQDGQPGQSPPLSRHSSAARATSAGSVSVARPSSAVRVRSSASAVARPPPSYGSTARVASAGSLGRVRSVAKAASGTGSVVRIPSGGSAVGVSSAGKMPPSGSAARVPSSGSAAAARVPSNGSVPGVSSVGSSVARQAPSISSATRIPSGGASATKLPSSTSAGRVPTRISATRVGSSGSGVVRVRSSGSGSRQTSSGPFPASSISAGGEAEASLLPSSESGPVPAVRQSVSSGGGSGGAGAAGSSGAGAEPPTAVGPAGMVAAQSRHELQPERAAVESETSAEDPSPLRALSAGPSGGEFAGLGRSSASRPSVGGIPADGGSGTSLQLTGSIDHHHYHHYEESGESSQPTDVTADTEEGEPGCGSDAGQVPEDTVELTGELLTADSPEETPAESEPSSQPQWETSESQDYSPEDYPEDSSAEDGLEASREEELAAGSSEEGEEEGGQGDISRQISEEMQQMMRQAYPTEPEPEPEPRVSATEQKRSVSIFRTASREADSADGMPAGGGGGRLADQRSSGRELSAPVRRPSQERRPSRRRDDHSSASEPGLPGRRSGARLPPRNVETIAEIRETGVERAITETTREQAGDRLAKETVRREVRRKVSSAPHPKQMSYTKQATRRSVCSDGVTEWLESQADDTCLKVDGREADVFEYLRREFPYVHVSAETKRRLLSMYRQQMKYIMSLVEPVESRKIKIRRQDVLKRQALMTDILRQQKAHDDRFRQISDAKRREAKIRNMPRDSKISCLRAQRYVSSFQQQFQARSVFNKSREELLLRAVFEEMLEIQRSRLRAVRQLEKQSITEFYDANGYTSDLNRVHQYYEANFRELAEMLSKERADLMLSQKQQRRLNDRIKREFREYMEADVRSLNDKIVNSWEPQFRELDADRVRSDLYEANWKFCVQ